MAIFKYTDQRFRLCLKGKEFQVSLGGRYLVVRVGDGSPLDLLLGVLGLLQLEDVLVEEVVQVLVGIVDAQLFEAVLLCTMYTCNVIF